MEPRWTHGNKYGIGTAYSQDSKLWYTLWRGIVTEVYYPLIDHPQLRDLEFLVTDGADLFHEEKRDMVTVTERLSARGLGYRVVSSDPEGRYSIRKEVIAAPHLPCLLVHTIFALRPEYAERLRLFAIAAPHLDVGGWGNNAYVHSQTGRTVLMAERNGYWMAMGADVPFARASCGYVGTSDGWSDLREHHSMEWEFDTAPNGNVALTGELDVRAAREFTLAVGFGRGAAHALSTLYESLGTSYEVHRQKFEAQWERVWNNVVPLERVAGDGGNLLHASYGVLLAHEDKTFPGAFIASLSIPWGHTKGDSDRGGYHLVWIRDLVQAALGLLAAGDTESPRRTLIYLAASQQPDGGFPQNCWLDGTPYWMGVQLDEVAFPILLAWQLHRAHALDRFDPYPMVLAAARFLVDRGPATQQERWEEAAGYSPSTLAVTIAALVCAGCFARNRGDNATADVLEEYADFLESKVDEWTVTTTGTVAPGTRRHFIRIRPIGLSDPTPDEDPDRGILSLANQPPGAPVDYPANAIVDAGFLELVRYGIRSAADPVIVDSLKVVDAVLKVNTPFGPVWRRYNHDGYGDQSNGAPFEGYGVGHAWPILTGERGHFELAAGRDPRPYLAALELLATGTGLLTEQVWDHPDLPERHLVFGRASEAAMPLVWAHAEYLKLLRSTMDGKPFDEIGEVVRRYRSENRPVPLGEVWKRNRQPALLRSGRVLRVQGTEPFVLHWTTDDWRTVHDTPAHSTAVALYYVDLIGPRAPSPPIRFTFHWTARNSWEGRDYAVSIVPERAAGAGRPGSTDHVAWPASSPGHARL